MSRSQCFGAVALGFSLLASVSRAPAQTTGFVGVDPFQLYYGYYLPHQAAIAAQPRPTDTLNALTRERQQNAVTDRAGLYNPISPYALDDDLDPTRPYGASRKGERRGRIRSFATTANAAGRGPATHFQRFERFPQQRVGQGPNRNLAVHRQARGIGGGFGGMPSMTPGLR
jgi:hypothetical protein